MKIRKVGFYPNPEHSIPEGGGIHGCYEILCIQQGRAQLEWLGRLYTVEGPAAFLLSPNTPHTFRSLSGVLRYHYVEFDIVDATAFPTLPQLLQWNGMQDLTASPRQEKDLFQTNLLALEHLVKRYTYDKRPLLEEALEHDMRKMLNLVFYLLEHADRMEGRMESLQQAQHRTIEAIMRYMESNFREELSLQKLADLVHLNGSYLIRLFKRLQGKTPFAYLNELRITAATSYLHNSDLSIQAIAQASGYSSIHYFSYAFKREFGINPSEWRERKRKSEDYEVV